MSKPRTRSTADNLRDRAKSLLAAARAKEAAERRQQRKADTHRKIILGGWVMRQWGSDLKKMPPEVRARLEREITRPWDRAALGFASLPPTA